MRPIKLFADDWVQVKFCSLVSISPILVIVIPGTPIVAGFEIVAVDVGLAVVGTAVALALVGAVVGFGFVLAVFCRSGWVVTVAVCVPLIAGSVGG